MQVDQQQQDVEAGIVYINGDDIPPNLYYYPSNFDLTNYWINTKNIRTDARKGTYSLNDINVFVYLVKNRVTNILGDKDGFKTDLNQLIEARNHVRRYVENKQKTYENAKKRAQSLNAPNPPPVQLPQDHLNISLSVENERYFYGPTLKNATRRKNYNMRLAKFNLDATIENWNGIDFSENVLHSHTSPRSTTSTTQNDTTIETNSIVNAVTDAFEVDENDGDTDEDLVIMNKNKNVNKNVQISGSQPGTPIHSDNENSISDKNEMDVDENEGVQDTEWQKNVTNLQDYIPLDEVSTKTPGGPPDLTNIDNNNINKNIKQMNVGELDPVNHFKSNKFVKSDVQSIIKYEKSFDKWMKEINQYCNEMYENIKEDRKDPTLAFNDVRGLLSSYIHRMAQMMIAYRVYYHLPPKPSAFKVLLNTLDENKLNSTIFDYYQKQFSVLIGKKYIDKKIGERLKPYERLLIAPKDAYKVQHGKLLKSIQFQNMINPIPKIPHKKRKSNNGWGDFQQHRAKRLKVFHRKEIDYEKIQKQVNMRKAQIVEENRKKEQERIDKIKKDKVLNDFKMKFKSLENDLLKKLNQQQPENSNNNNQSGIQQQQKVANDVGVILNSYHKKLEEYESKHQYFDNKIQELVSKQQTPISPAKPFLNKQNEKRRGAEIHSPEFNTVYKSLEGFKVIDHQLYKEKQNEKGQDIYQSLLNKQNFSNKGVVKELQGLWVRTYNFYQCESVNKTLVYAVRFDSG